MGTTGEIFKKIPEVMADIGAIGKNKTNPQQGYKFRGIDDVYLAVNAALSKHGIFCAPTVMSMTREERQSQKGGTLLYTILNIKYTFYASDGSSFECVTVGEAMDSGDKSCNKAMSAAQKYAFFQVFSIPTEEHKDTELETHEIKDKKPAGSGSQKQGGASSSTPPPAPSQGANYAFLKAMGEQKVRVGEDLYYKTLGVLGFEKSSEILDREVQKEVYKMIIALPNKMEVA